MDLIKQGYEVLYIWRDQNIEQIEQQVMELKKIANVKLENSERLSLGKSCGTQGGTLYCIEQYNAIELLITYSIAQ